jgi:hypothetical protein
MCFHNFSFYFFSNNPINAATKMMVGSCSFLNLIKSKIVTKANDASDIGKLSLPI